jgi:hypothetical protein
MKRLPHVPPRTPWQDIQATQRRYKWIERLAYVAIGLVLVAILCGQIGA